MDLIWKVRYFLSILLIANIKPKEPTTEPEPVMKGEMMPFNKEQLKAYWQTNKETLNQKRRERRRLARLATKEVSQVEPRKKVEPLAVSYQQVEPVNPKMANLNEVEPKVNLETANLPEVSHGKPMNSQPSLEMANLEKVEPIKLWSSHYSVQKPYCYSCFQAGIKETEYAFCSFQKVQDALTIRLPNRYLCNVYHWTLYQGQGRLGGSM